MRPGNPSKAFNSLSDAPRENEGMAGFHSTGRYSSDRKHGDSEDDGTSDSDGDASEDEYLDPALMAEAQRLLRPAEIEATRGAFRKLDHAHTGALTPQQVHAAMRQIAPQVSRGEVDKLIVEFDENGDGQIQLDEFLVMMGRISRVGSISDAVDAAHGGPPSTPTGGGGAGSRTCLPTVRAGSSSGTMC